MQTMYHQEWKLKQMLFIFYLMPKSKVILKMWLVWLSCLDQGTLTITDALYFVMNILISLFMNGSPQVLVTLTSEQGKIIQALHTVKIHGQSQFSTALQIAQVNQLH